MPLVLCDTGPLVALVDRRDPHHTTCVATIQSLPTDTLVTTWPCFTAAMHLGIRAVGPVARKEFWRLYREGVLIIHSNSEAEASRMDVLMEQYEDAPMDLADASLVAAGEALGISRIFTLDRHFRAYRPRSLDIFDVVP